MVGYSDLEQIGRGGFSVVYAATQTAFRRRVALKVLDISGGEARRLEREAHALGALADIPNVLQAFHITTTTDGRPVLVTALMAGPVPCGLGPDDGRFSLVLRWVRQISEAVDEAHRRGVFHRDIKPANVLLSTDGAAHLADFGIAALEERSTSTTTAFSFSPPFAPPERLTDEESDLGAGDIYSLAATTYAVVVGSPPFGTTTQGGVHGLITRVVAEPLPRPEWMSDRMYAVFARAMAKLPADRYRSAAEFADQLEASVQDRPSLDAAPVEAVHPPLDWTPRPADPPEYTTPRTPSPTPSAGSAREPDGADPIPSGWARRRLGLAVALVVVVAAAVGVVVVGRGDGSAEVASGGASPSTDAPARSTSTTTTVPPVDVEPTLDRCELQGAAELVPGIEYAVDSPQDVQLDADLLCGSSGGDLSGRLQVGAAFPSLGISGGSATGEGAISWIGDAELSSPLEVEVVVDTQTGFQLFMEMRALSGPGAGQIGTAVTELVFELSQGELLQRIDVGGTIEWTGPDG